MKDSKVIKSPEAFQLLADETRLKMVYLMRAKEMTVSQMASELGLTPQTIYHHIKKLRDVGMVEVSREERIDHLVESYYRATAGVFLFADGACSKDGDEAARMRKTLEALATLGHELNVEPASISKTAKLKEDLRKHRENSRIIERVYDLDDIDPFIQKDVVEFMTLIEMSDKEFEKHLATLRTLRKWLRTQKTDTV
jgi:DNA-binding transcriptional ArsR family regulator